MCRVRKTLLFVLILSILIFYFIPVVFAYLMHPLSRVLVSIIDYHLQVWRFSIILTSVPGILALIGMYFLPESAKFLIAKGKNEFAYKVLDRLFFYNKKQSLESMGVTGVTQPHIVSEREESNFFKNCRSDLIMIYKLPNVKSYFNYCIIMCLLFFV